MIRAAMTAILQRILGCEVDQSRVRFLLKCNAVCRRSHDQGCSVMLQCRIATLTAPPKAGALQHCRRIRTSRRDIMTSLILPAQLMNKTACKGSESEGAPLQRSSEFRRSRALLHRCHRDPWHRNTSSLVATAHRH